MSHIKNIMQEELRRLGTLSRKYSDKIASLPYGAISGDLWDVLHIFIFD